MSPIRFSAKETQQFMRKIRPIEQIAPIAIQKPEKVKRMPDDSIRLDCICGVRGLVSSTPKDFAEIFAAQWWRRHSGPGHGPANQKEGTMAGKKNPTKKKPAPKPKQKPADNSAGQETGDSAEE